MTRIVLLGCAGSGKSTLARRLGAKTGAPVIWLDAIWQPHWGPDDVAAFRETMRQAHAGEAWISDGNFAAATFDVRMPRATQVVWLEAPRWLCLARAAMRVFRRDSDHRLAGLGKALRFVWNFDRINRPLIETLRLQFAPNVPVVRLRGASAVDAFVAGAPARRD